MNESIKRSIAIGQPQMRMICIDVNGTGAPPTVGGFDAKKVTEVEKIGTGHYAIHLKYPFNASMSVNPRAFCQSLTDGVFVKPLSSTNKVIEFECLDDSGVAADCDFSVMILGCDGRLLY